MIRADFLHLSICTLPRWSLPLGQTHPTQMDIRWCYTGAAMFEAAKGAR